MKKVWFINQNSYLPEDGPHTRHYSFGKYMVRDGYEPFVFAGNVLHHVNSIIPVDNGLYVEKIRDGVHFVYIKTHEYHENDVNRIRNIISFYNNIFKVCNTISAKYGKPDLIYASCMYPTALLAGVKMAKRYSVPCISETRDIVPDEFIIDGALRENGLIANCTRKFMKYIYDRSTALVFTMSGGMQYITDMKWDTSHGGKIDINRVYYINNGVDLELFDSNAEKFVVQDDDLGADNFNVVYFGAIRFFNQMPLFIETAKELKKRDRNDIKILMWGTGTKLDEMRTKLQEEGLDNLVLKGYVKKQYIPGIAKRADAFIATGNSVAVNKYGASFNKLFDYLAAGKPIILPFLLSDSIIANNHAGYELRESNHKLMADTIIRLADMEKNEYQAMCNNSRNLSKNFDYRNLTHKVEKIIEECIERFFIHK